MAIKTYRPTILAGILYAREIGSTLPLMAIGGVQEMTTDISSKKITQANTSGGGGNRASLERVEDFMVKAKLQDLNAVNIARCLRSVSSEVIAGTVVDELQTATRGGLIKLLHPSPTAVVLKTALDVVISAVNYEVRPEGIYIYEDAPAIATPATPVKVSYAHSGYDVHQLLTRSSPLLHLYFAGMNEVESDAPFLVDLWRVQQSLTKSLALISADAFATLDFEGEVLQDPTRAGVGISKYAYIRQA